MPTTIRDVAKRAGVSVKTVSRVLNQEPMVNENTRTRVEKVIAQLEYVPNISAQRLARGRAKVIALLFDNVSQTYLNDVLKGCFQEARETGFGVLTYPCDVQKIQDRQAILQLAAQRRVDGFIFTPPCDNVVELLQDLTRLNVPFVRLSPRNHRLPYPHVRIRDYESAISLTEYLITLGHRRIGFIMGSQDHSASEARLDGFRDALKKHKIQLDEKLVCSGDWTFAAGMTGARKLLGCETRPTAIFASNDDIAAGVLFTAHQLGIRVPEQLTVTGFDDVPLAQQVWPPLTTMRQPILQIAQMATHLLTDLIKKHPVKTVHYDLPTELVIRESSARAPDIPEKRTVKKKSR